MYSRNSISLIIIFLILTLLISCNTLTNNHDEIDEPIQIPITKAEGPGGSAYMAGDVRDYLRWDKPVTNTDLYVMNQNDYSDTLVHIFINSTDASFRITELPLDTVDLIFTNKNYLCAKIDRFVLDSNGNSFYQPYSSGFFIDSTVTLLSVADSVGRPDAPPFGIQGYGDGIVVRFKMHIPDSLSLEIVESSGCDTVEVYHYHDPVFDPEIGDVYLLKCNGIISVYEKLIYFNWRKEVRYASPLICETSP